MYDATTKPQLLRPSAINTLSSSSSSPAVTQEAVAVSHKSPNVGAIVGEAIAGVVVLAVLIGCCYFKFCRGKRRAGGTSERHEHKEGEKSNPEP
ncbi:hypothetical protein M407DRAFT_18016 [Tulasnella calospora MUT 4182]|uniref:Uncharacterized protein n=1 Tax=Tulasnella calospora MUT 4182 TaxID=1051891 RepID=A0A0C3QWD0_9AGAM|nr:hypothetical protein M407DRAFT_18016 [Tulasnella calospora MUT 4182]